MVRLQPDMTLDSFLTQLQLYPTGSLREQDRQQIRRIDAALPITADVSRADMLLYGRLSDQRLLILRHVMPNSISSHYPATVSGRNVPAGEQPLVQHAFVHGRGGRRHRRVDTGRSSRDWSAKAAVGERCSSAKTLRRISMTAASSSGVVTRITTIRGAGSTAGAQVYASVAVTLQTPAASLPPNVRVRAGRPAGAFE